MKSGLMVEIRGYVCFVNESKLSVPVKRWVAIEHYYVLGSLHRPAFFIIPTALCRGDTYSILFMSVGRRRQAAFLQLHGSQVIGPLQEFTCQWGHKVHKEKTLVMPCTECMGRDTCGEVRALTSS